MLLHAFQNLIVRRHHTLESQNMVLTGTLHPYWLAFRVLEGKKSSSILSSCDSEGYNNSGPGKPCPLLYGGINAVEVANHFLPELRLAPQDGTQTWHHYQNQESVARAVVSLGEMTYCHTSRLMHL